MKRSGLEPIMAFILAAGGACGTPLDEATGATTTRSDSENDTESARPEFSSSDRFSGTGVMGEVNTGGSIGSSWGDEDSTGALEPVQVHTFPGGLDSACEDLELPFAPPFDSVGPSAEDAFWMMWFSRRATTFDDPALPAELATLGFDNYVPIEVGYVGFQAYVTSRDDAVVVAFRGSQEILDWLVDFSFVQIPGTASGLDGMVHSGFAAALGAAWEPLVAEISAQAGDDRPIWLTGHSLGGSLAMMAAPRLSAEGFNIAPVYVFGPPRAGNEPFALAVQQQLDGRLYRFVNERDLVPHVAPWGASAAVAANILPWVSGLTQWLIATLDYTHPGRLFHFEDDDTVVEYPPMDNSEDLDYWAQIDAEGWFALVSATEQSTWHAEDEYLCKARRWAFGHLGRARPNRRPRE